MPLPARTSSMKRDYARHYRELYERHWWWRAREALLLEELERRKPPAGWGAILDVGCGDALFFDQLECFGEVWGVESDAELVTEGNRYRSRVHVGPFDVTYAPGRKFGLILMLDVLEHLPDPEGALRHAASLLRPDGWLLATVPAFRVLWTAHDDFNSHRDRYTVSSFRSLAAQSGLAVDLARYLFHWLFPAKLAVRAVEAALPGRAKPERVPSPWINQLLYRASVMEWRVLRGVHLPFGSSVIGWCRLASA